MGFRNIHICLTVFIIIFSLSANAQEERLNLEPIQSPADFTGNNKFVNIFRGPTLTTTGNDDNSIIYTISTDEHNQKVKHEYEYDENFHITMITVSKKNFNWFNQYRHSYEYDNNGNMTRWLLQVWKNFSFVNNSQRLVTYNAENQIAFVLTQVWIVDHWKDYWRSFTAYNDFGKTDTILQEFFKDGKWINERKWKMTYNDNNQIIEQLIKIWAGDTWQNRYSYIYEYKNDSLLKILTKRIWNGSDWINNERYFYSYLHGEDENILIDTLVKEVWRDTTWIYQERKIYQYDENNFQKYYTLQLWIEGKWTDVERQKFFHDDVYHLLKVEVQRFKDDEWKDTLNSNEIIYVDTNNSIDLHGNSYLYYSTNCYLYEIFWNDLVSVAHPSKNENHFAFPNPATGVSNISFVLDEPSLVNIEVSNPSGQIITKVYSDYLPAGEHTKKVDLSGFRQGVYFYTIHTSKDVITGKIILLK